MKPEDFEVWFGRLNKNQKVAVESIDGPVMVIAGPGTGKTRVLTMRIANILRKTDTDPESILALTFTEAAAGEMKKRLVDLIGRDGYRVQIDTFHAYCQGVIHENPDIFAFDEETALLSDLERVKLMQKILDREKLEVIRPVNAPLLYLNSLLGAIKQLKREGVDPPKLASLAKLVATDEKLSTAQKWQKEKERARLGELALVYQKYQDELAEMGRFDFEDIISRVVEEFGKRGNLLAVYQERAQYILVDEYQDTNSVQNKLVFELASYFGEQANVFVVGDPRQSIYRFQGASKENLKEFVARFPRGMIIDLKENYRSRQPILDAANRLIDEREDLVAVNRGGKRNSVRLALFGSEVGENYFVTEQIKEWRKNGAVYSQIAILARKNEDLVQISRVLANKKIPYLVQGGGDVLSDGIIIRLITLLKVIANFSILPDSQLFTLLNFDFFDFDKAEILRLAVEAASKKVSLTVHLTKSKNRRVREFVNRIADWQQMSVNMTLGEFFQNLVQQSNLINHLIKQKNYEGIYRLNSLFEEIKHQEQAERGLSLAKFLENLSLMQEQNIGIPEADVNLNVDAVCLTSAHRAKGMEWDRVIIFRGVDNRWGGKTHAELIKLPGELLEFGGKDEDLEAEERRLFYVAMTRAREEVVITCAKSYQESWGERLAIPSRFVEEIGKELVNLVDANAREVETENIVGTMFAETVTRDPHTEALLKDQVDKFRLSVTALNNYLNCGYKFLLNNILRLPKAKEAYLALGTAVHKALEMFYVELGRKNKVPSVDFLIAVFERSLAEETLTVVDQRERLKQGNKLLRAYYGFYKKDFKKAIVIEKYFGYSPPITLDDDIALVGKVDRIDLVSKKGGGVRVVDYKTGKPRSRNEIEGKTKNADGSYKRQLVFYQLLSELDKRFPYKVVETELDFVEPKDNGQFKKERFVITKSEVEDLKLVIRRGMKKIRRLEFDKTSKVGICQKCEFKFHCWPDGLPIARTNE